MGSRLELQTMLETLLGSGNVYFQPPSSYQMSYPCIVYERSRILSAGADNLPYKHDNKYTITVMDEDPDSEIPITVSKLARCSHDRAFKSDQLNHDVFTLIY